MRLNKDLSVIVLIIIVGAVIFRALFQDGLMVTDDYRHHAVRTANYYLAYQQGQLPPQWGPNLNQGMGYPAFLYTYPAPYILSTALHILGFSVQESLNLAIMLLILLGLVFAYIFARVNDLSPPLSGILALCYICNPYILLNVFWRGAFGEIAFYIFIPFVFILIQKIISKNLSFQKKLLYASCLGIGYAILILTHLISLVVLIPILTSSILLELFLIQKSEIHNRMKTILWLCFAAITGLILSAWYWIPAVFERSYIQLESSRINQMYMDHYISWSELFSVFRTITSSQYFLDVLQVGWLTLLSLPIVFLLYLQNKQHIGNFSIRIKSAFWLVVLFCSVFFITPQSSVIWDNVEQLSVTQFPWRLLWVTQLAAFMICINFFQSKHYFKKPFATLVLLSCLVSIASYAHPKGFSSAVDYEWYESIETGSSFDEFRPIWATGEYGHLEQIQFYTTSLNNVVVEKNILRWTGSLMEYEVDLNQSLHVVHKTLYFPGWLVEVDGTRREIDYENEMYQGLISYQLDEGSSSVRVSFSESTELRYLGRSVSLYGLILLVSYFIYFVITKIIVNIHTNRLST